MNNENILSWIERLEGEGQAALLGGFFAVLTSIIYTVRTIVVKVLSAKHQTQLLNLKQRHELEKIEMATREGK